MKTQFIAMNTKEFLAKMAQPSGEKKGAWFAVTNRTDEETELLVFDFIGAFGIEAKELVTAIKAAAGKKLTVRINSPGGDVFDGIAIFNALNDHDAEVHVVVDGLAASVASIIAMAGETITMNTGARMMIHDPWMLTVGNAEDHLEGAKVLNDIAKDLVNIYARRAGVGKRMVRTMMQAETWLGAEEAVEHGFADAVAGAKAEAKAFSVPKDMIKHPEEGMPLDSRHVLTVWSAEELGPVTTWAATTASTTDGVLYVSPRVHVPEGRTKEPATEDEFLENAWRQVQAWEFEAA